MTRISTIFQNTRIAGQYLSGVAKRRKSSISTYQLAFNREDDGAWFIDLPEWQGAHASLRMVEGADLLLEHVGQGSPRVEVEVAKSNAPIAELDRNKDYFRCDQIKESLICGAYYQVGLEDFNHTMWLCPVTLFVLGEYPQYLYIKKKRGVKEEVKRGE